jgi:ATP adenylyltransferase
MSHVYQPVMLRELLKRNGRATVAKIARALLNEDRSQKYYSEITKDMVGRVLTNRNVVKRDGGACHPRQSPNDLLQSAATRP